MRGDILCQPHNNCTQDFIPSYGPVGRQCHALVETVHFYVASVREGEVFKELKTFTTGWEWQKHILSISVSDPTTIQPPPNLQATTTILFRTFVQKVLSYCLLCSPYKFHYILGIVTYLPTLPTFSIEKMVWNMNARNGICYMHIESEIFVKISFLGWFFLWNSLKML